MEEYVLSYDDPVLDKKVHQVLDEELTFEGFQMWLIDSGRMIDELLFHYLEQASSHTLNRTKEEDEWNYYCMV